jgi:peroxiredoxin
MKTLTIIAAFLACLLGSMSNAQAQANSKPAKAKKMPNFSFYNALNNKIVTADQIKYDKYLTVVYFDPSCEHCEATAADIAKQISKFKNTKLVWVSISDPEPIAGFKAKYFPKATSSSMLFLSDKNTKIFSYFNNLIDTPTFIIYDKDKNQVAQLELPTVADIVKHYK